MLGATFLPRQPWAVWTIDLSTDWRTVTYDGSREIQPYSLLGR